MLQKLFDKIFPTNYTPAHRAITVKEILSVFTDDFYCFVGKNVKINEGIIFFHISTLFNYEQYSNETVYIAKVTFTKNSYIFIDTEGINEGFLQARNIILSDKKIFNPSVSITNYLHFSTESCKNAWMFSKIYRK